MQKKQRKGLPGILAMVVMGVWLCVGLAAGPAAITDSTSGDGGGGGKAIAIAPIRAADHLAGSRYALVIGINDYRDPAIPDLTTCEADARAVYDLLTDPRTGAVEKSNVTLLLGPDATYRKIRKGLSELARIPADATVFVYFSGHGAKERDEAYWITQDAELKDLAATAMPDREVRAFLDRIPSGRVVVMLDCCYAAATVKGGKTVAAGFDAVLDRFTGKGRAFLMAAGSGEEAIEAKDLRRSVFTHYLVAGLNGRADANTDGVIVLTELTSYIDKHVADEARVRGGVQRPVVKMDDVTEPSKFRLTIDADRLARNLRETAEAKALRARRLAAVERLYLDEKLTRDQAQLGMKLLKADAAMLDAYDRKRLGYIEQVADGELAADKLQRALDLVETPSQRAARLQREAAALAAAQREAAERAEKQRLAELALTAVPDQTGRAVTQQKARLAQMAGDNALARDPSRYLQRAEEFLKQKDYEAAVDELTRAYRFEKNGDRKVAVLLRLAQTHPLVTAKSMEDANKRLQMLQNCWRTARQIDPTNVEATRALLDFFYQQARAFPSAMHLWDQLYNTADDVLKVVPDMTVAHRYRGIAQTSRMERMDIPDNERDQARADLEAALAASPEDAELVYQLAVWRLVEAQAQRRFGRMPRAAQLQDEALKMVRDYWTAHPDSVQAELNLLRVLSVAGRRPQVDQALLEEARERLDDLEKKLADGKNVRDGLELASHLIRLDKERVELSDGTTSLSGLMRAEQLLRSVVQANPDNTQAIIGLANLLKQQGRVDDAIQFFLLAREERPIPVSIEAMRMGEYQVLAVRELADLYLANYEQETDPEKKAEWLDKSRDEAAELAARAPGSGWVDLIEGKLALVDGDLAKAVKKLDSANNQLEGLNIDALRLGAQALLQMGQTGAAAQRLEQLIATPAGSRFVKPYLDLARLRVRQNNLDRAMTYLETVLANNPDNTEALLLKSEILARQARIAQENGDPAAAELERQKQRKIVELLAMAKANDSKAQGKTALAALDALLRLDPNHWEAKRLRDKISGYYGPSKVGDSITNSIGMKLTYIPAGEFLMGSPRNEEGRDDDETQHRVRISKPFLMGVTEVTQGQWKAVMGNNPSYFKGSDALPVETVSWDDAAAFCKKLSEKEGRTYRLPTEAEWEYACRAGTSSAYYTGNGVEALTQAGWASYDSKFSSEGKTRTVGGFKANAWGLYDMHGNVWEWCSDWYGVYPNGTVTDPPGPNTGSSRVLRGGGWDYGGPTSFRSASRGWGAPGFRYGFYGFRVSLDLPGNP